MAEKKKLSLKDIKVNSFVTMLDEDQQEQVAGGWSSRWYHGCITPTEDGTGFCESGFSFDDCKIDVAGGTATPR